MSSLILLGVFYIRKCLENKSNTQEKPKGFLDLPPELRNKVYDWFLADNPGGYLHSPSYGDGNTTNQDVVLLEDLGRCKFNPGILATCKQVYREAITVLYSKNAFYIRDPSHLSEFSKVIGPANFSDIKTMDLRVEIEDIDDIDPWVALLEDLVIKVKGLRVLRVEMTAFWHIDLPTDQENVTGEWVGLGRNLDFLEALRRIQHLEKLVISGYYNKKWPKYLRSHTQATVKAE